MGFDDRWAQLETDIPAGRDVGKQKIIVVDTPACTMELVLERRQANLAPARAIYVEFSEPVGIVEPPRGTQNVDIFPMDGDQKGIGVLLRDPDLDSIFSSLAEDVATSLKEAESPEKAYLSFCDRLAKWRRLLSVGRRGLSPSQQRGLYGELVTLRDVLAPTWGIDRAVAAWHGPEGSSRDFERQEKALESKVSTTNEPQRMIINGERQLDDSGLEVLVLVHHSLEVIQGGAANLVSAVDTMRDLVAGHAISAKFEDALVEAGYLDEHSYMYRAPGYHLHKSRYWHVTAGFPRLIQSDLPDGIGSVRYSLAVDACTDHQIDIDTLKQLIALDA